LFVYFPIIGQETAKWNFWSSATCYYLLA